MQAQAYGVRKRGGEHLLLDVVGNFQVTFDPFMLSHGCHSGPQLGQGAFQRDIFGRQLFDEVLLVA